MARFVNLCFEVPEDLEKFDNVELLNRNGRYFLRCFYSHKNYSDLSLSSVHCSSGDMLYVVNHMLHFFNGTDFSVNKAYEIWLNGVLNFDNCVVYDEKKKNVTSCQSKKFSQIGRRKKTQFRDVSDERRN